MKNPHPQMRSGPSDPAGAVCYVFTWLMSSGARRCAAVGSMRRVLVSCALIAAGVVALASARAQGVRTAAPCSPVIDRTQGNATINYHEGACTVELTPTQLAKITEAALAGV